jgi:hypothetical protein
MPGAVHTVGFFSSNVPDQGPVNFYLYEVPWQHTFEFNPDAELRLATSQLLREYDPTVWLFDLGINGAGKHRISLHGPIPAPPELPSPLTDVQKDPPAGT